MLFTSLGQNIYSPDPLFCYFLSEGLLWFLEGPQALTSSELPALLYSTENWDLCLSLQNHTLYVTFHNKSCFISFPIGSPANNSLPRIREGLSYHTKPSNFPTRPGVSQDFLPKIILASNNFWVFHHQYYNQQKPFLKLTREILNTDNKNIIKWVKVQTVYKRAEISPHQKDVRKLGCRYQWLYGQLWGLQAEVVGGGSLGPNCPKRIIGQDYH